LIVLSFYKMTLGPPRWVATPLTALGCATYGVYLLHPLVYAGVTLVARRLGLMAEPLLLIAATAALTIMLAIMLYRIFELPLIGFGKRLTARRQPVSVRAEPERAEKPQS
jgi:peptidoglycan/LPS O-acetylase OafA/YrhL